MDIKYLLYRFITLVIFKFSSYPFQTFSILVIQNCLLRCIKVATSYVKDKDNRQREIRVYVFLKIIVNR